MADYYDVSDGSDFYGTARQVQRLKQKARRQPLQPSSDSQFRRLVCLQSSQARTCQNAKESLPHTHTKSDEDVDESPDLSCWQSGSETILEFLRRAPVVKTVTAELGPWLWVHYPRSSSGRTNKSARNADFAGFQQDGRALLDSFAELMAKIKADHADKADGVITRRLKPFRDKLQVEILETAKTAGVTVGKWLLFPDVNEVARTWRQVAEATAQGRLGPTSKVATHDPSPRGAGKRVICVYTQDFSDEEDVKRVLLHLVELGLVSRTGRSIYYKCNAYTYLDLMSGNPYKLSASIYSSKSILEAEPQNEASRQAPQKARPEAEDDFYSALDI